MKANKNSLTEEVVGASLFRVYSKLYYGNFNKENKEIDFVGYKKGNYELFEIKNTDSFKISNYKEFISNSKNYEQITIVSKNLHKKESSVNILPVHQLLTDSRFA